MARRSLDFSKAKTYPLKRRKSKVRLRELGRLALPGASLLDFLDGLPRILAAADLRETARAIARSARKRRPVILGMGAHAIKVGLSPLIVDFMRRGILTCIAMNGAGIIHDFELAQCGRTSEEVSQGLKNGSFGMAFETGSFLNGTIKKAADASRGIGETLGEEILRRKLPYGDVSILATGAEWGVPVTVHVAVGTDIIHMHPTVDGSAIGAATLKDFHRLTSEVAGLEGGVFINLGSAVVIPEVFLKALNLARNLGHGVNRFLTVNMDFIQHYRPLMNVLTRPVNQGGKGIQLIGHHEIMIPLLFAATLAELES